MRKESDLYLVEACLKKDLIAWANFVKKYSGLVYISVENRLKRYGIHITSQDIEDIRQDIFSDIWKNSKLSQITNRNDIAYWIAILSGNAALEHFRSKEARRPQNTISLCQKIGDKELDEILQADIPGPDDELARAETERRIDESMESLAGLEKTMMKLYLFHGKRYHEIAEFLRVPQGTVSSYIKRAREKLRKKLKEN